MNKYFTENMPAFYHIFDGMINEEIGSNSIENIRYLYNDIDIIHNDIIFLIPTYDKRKNSIEYKIINKTENKQNNYKFDKNKYYIIPQSHDKHATTIILFSLNDNWLLMTVNSGMGIKIHRTHNLNGGEQIYEPYICYDINNKINEKMTIELFMEYILLYCDYIKDIENNEKTISETKNIFDGKIKIIKNNYTFYDVYTDKYIINGNEMTLNNLFTSNIEKCCIKNKDTYYNVFNNFMKISGCTINNLQLGSLGGNDNRMVHTAITENNKLYFEKKMTFYIKEGSVYIYSQKSGSCAWYSIYWSILLFYIITNKIDDYYNIINTILNTMTAKIVAIQNINNSGEKIINNGILFYFLNKLKLLQNKIIFQTETYCTTIYENEVTYMAEFYNEKKNLYIDTNKINLVNGLYAPTCNDIYIGGGNIMNFIVFNSFINNKMNIINTDMADLVDMYSLNNGDYIQNNPNLLIIYKRMCDIISNIPSDPSDPIDPKFFFNPSYYIFYKYMKQIYKKYLNININEDEDTMYKLQTYCHFLHIIMLFLIDFKNKDNMDSFDKISTIFKADLCDTTKILPQQMFIYYRMPIFNMYTNPTDYTQYMKWEPKDVIIFEKFFEHMLNNPMEYNKMDKDEPVLPWTYAIIQLLDDDQTIKYAEYLCNEIYRTKNLKIMQFLYTLINKQPVGQGANGNYNSPLSKYNTGICEHYLNTSKTKKNFITMCKQNMDKFIINDKKVCAFYTQIKYVSNDDITFVNKNDDNNTYSIKDYTNTIFEKYALCLNNTLPCICLVPNKITLTLTHNIYLFGDKIIKFVINQNEIKEIYVNNNLTISHENLTHPFKYMFPFANDFQLFYINKNDGLYNVIYFVSQQSFKTTMNDFIGGNVQTNSIYEFTINPNNLLFPNNFNVKTQQDFEFVCNTFGYNQYNIYLCNICKINDAKKYGSLPNEIMFELIQYVDVLSMPNMYKIQRSFNFLNHNDDNYILSLPAYFSEQKNIKKKTAICRIDENIKVIQKLLEQKQKKIEEKYKSSNKIFMDCFFNNKNIYEIFIKKEGAQQTYEYVESLRYRNMINGMLKDIKQTTDEKKYIDNLCSVIKINEDRLYYKKNNYSFAFEYIFEIIFGNEITEQQHVTYIKLINTYNNSNYKNTDVITNITNIDNIINYKNITQGGGAITIYPIQHFMMGKGKSSVITPLLLLYFTLVEKKIVIIVVPIHLLPQTKDSLEIYLCFFNIKEKVQILSESEVKIKFLEGEYMDSNDNYIMLMDEFDTLLNPLTSNFNMIENKSGSTKKLFTIIKENIFDKNNNLKENIFDKIRNNNLEEIDTINVGTNNGEYETNKEYLLKEINSIIKSINNNTFKENINWGINKKTCLAVPYTSKDTYEESCNFTSPVITIMLTLYYHLVLHNKKLTDILCEFIMNTTYLSDIFSADEKTRENINKYFTDNYHNKYDELINYIADKILLTEKQYNTSFIDILNISKMHKIGYSGTVNMNKIKSDNINIIINEDTDEKENIKEAISKSKILLDINGIQTYFSNNIDTELIIFFKKKALLNEYGAIIDTCGLFKNVKNEIIAKKICELLDRMVIYINEKNEKYVHKKDNISEKYNENILYENPFIYYSQSHVIGIDIKQDKYPNIKGLCIIDVATEYTIVAQSMFRLRKLNMGHTINFLLLNAILKLKLDSSTINQFILLDMLITNEKNTIENRDNLLAWQTIKSDIRKSTFIEKKKKIEKIEKIEFKNYYLENVKYYFNTNDEIDDILINNAITNILPIDTNIIKINPDIIKNLIYGISDMVLTENVKENVNENKREYQYNNIANIYNIIGDGYRKVGCNFLDFLNNNFYDIRTRIDLDTQINLLTIQYKVNIFEQFDITSICYVYYKNRFIIVPFIYYMFLYDNHHVFDMETNIINTNFEYKIGSSLRQKLLDNKYAKLLMHNLPTDEIKKIFNDLNHPKVYLLRLLSNIKEYYYIVNIAGEINAELKQNINNLLYGLFF